ncbi:MAG TPA: hypothetical protein VF465_10320 [Flavobacterium sp.]|uniref:hypothetical protein n=1 Tax=Flavobacterium sp. TaxID=239 RepID=UPI0028ED962B|nr:hypothetical protein [uncultured Flavobacterium sp.]
MKYYLLSLLFIAAISSYAQNTKTYRLFDKELEMSLMTFKIDDENNINVTTANNKETIVFSETLNSTANKNSYVLKTDSFKDKNKKGFALLEFIEDEKIIVMYDTIFQNKIQIEKFISKPLNLKEAMAVYLIQDLSLEKIKQFPFITAISDEKLSLLKLKIKEREKYLEDISQNLEMKKQMAIYIKNKMWLNSQCLLLGYKFPSNKNEDEFIISKIKE